MAGNFSVNGNDSKLQTLYADLGNAIATGKDLELKDDIAVKADNAIASLITQNSAEATSYELAVNDFMSEVRSLENDLRDLDTQIENCPDEEMKKNLESARATLKETIAAKNAKKQEYFQAAQDLKSAVNNLADQRKTIKRDKILTEQELKTTEKMIISVSDQIEKRKAELAKERENLPKKEQPVQYNDSRGTITYDQHVKAKGIQRDSDRAPKDANYNVYYHGTIPNRMAEQGY